LKRAVKCAEITNLQVKGSFGPNQRIDIVPLSAFRFSRGIEKRDGICVASKETMNQLLNDIESPSSLREDLILSDLVVVP
jgi:hypothetical protein